jgi:hypothetical protein
MCRGARAGSYAFSWRCNISAMLVGQSLGFVGLVGYLVGRNFLCLAVRVKLWRLGMIIFVRVIISYLYLSGSPCIATSSFTSSLRGVVCVDLGLAFVSKTLSCVSHMRPRFSFRLTRRVM